MHRTLDDIEGRYVVVPPGEGVLLADVHNAPYLAPDYTVLEDGGRVPRIVVRPWSYEHPDTLANAGGFGPTDMRPLSPMPMASPEVVPVGAGISFADMVRTISPAAEPGTWREDSSAPFWTPDDPHAISGPSFDDFDPRVSPDVWRDDNSAPSYATWEDSDRYAAPYSPRSAALGTFRIPDLPGNATGWGLRERSPVGVDDIVPVLLASRWGRKILSDIWKAVGGIPGGRRPDGPPASAPTGRKGYPLGSHRAPSRNPPGKLNDQPSSGHAFDKVQDEGLMPSIVDQARRQGNPRPGNGPGTTRYYDKINDVSVIIDDKTGRVITTHYGDR